MPPRGVGGGVYAGPADDSGKPVAVGVVPGDSDGPSGAPTHDPVLVRRSTRSPNCSTWVAPSMSLRKVLPPSDDSQATLGPSELTDARIRQPAMANEEGAKPGFIFVQTRPSVERRMAVSPLMMRLPSDSRYGLPSAKVSAGCVAVTQVRPSGEYP